MILLQIVQRAACRRKERAPLWSGKRTVRTPIVSITPAILALKEQWEKKNYIDPKLYKEYNVKRGLRDEDGRGVLTGLTRVGEIQSYSVTEGEHTSPRTVCFTTGASIAGSW